MTLNWRFLAWWCLGNFIGTGLGTWIGVRTGCGLPVWPW